jgi:hypothetical protein
MSQGASFLDVTLRRMDAVNVFRTTARANRLDPRAAAVVQSQRPRRVATFTSPATPGEGGGSPSPIGDVTDITDGVERTLATNQLPNIPPIGPAEPK